MSTLVRQNALLLANNVNVPSHSTRIEQGS